MKFPVIRLPIFANIIIVIISAFISWFTLLFGIAHIFEGGNPDIPDSEHLIGVIAVTTLCVIGIIFLIITIAAIRGIIERYKKTKENLN